MDESEMSRLATLAESMAASPRESIKLIDFVLPGNEAAEILNDKLYLHIFFVNENEPSLELRQAVSSLRSVIKTVSCKDGESKLFEPTLEDLVAAGEKLIDDKRPEAEQLAGIAILWGVRNRLLTGDAVSRQKPLLDRIVSTVQQRYANRPSKVD